MRRRDSLEYQIMERQLAIKDSSSNSWAIFIKTLLHKYSLPNVVTLLYHTPTKESWKISVNSNVRSYWHNELSRNAKDMSSLCYINWEVPYSGKPHCLWSVRTFDPRQVQRAVIHVKIATQRYPLNTSHMGRKASNLCPCCKDSDETLMHFMLDCRSYLPTRLIHMPRIQALLGKINHHATRENVLQFLLDPSKLCQDVDLLDCAVLEARTYCFNLHLLRTASINSPDGIT